MTALRLGCFSRDRSTFIVGFKRAADHEGQNQTNSGEAAHVLLMNISVSLSVRKQYSGANILGRIFWEVLFFFKTCSQHIILKRLYVPLKSSDIQALRHFGKDHLAEQPDFRAHHPNRCTAQPKHLHLLDQGASTRL